MSACPHNIDTALGGCLKCALVEAVVIVGGSMADPDVALATKAGFEDGVWSERARCRAIVVRLFGSDWTGNEALRLIDGGGT